MDELRDRIAAALRAHDYWDGCTDRRCILASDCEGCLHRSNEMADGVIAALGLTEELGSRSHGTGLMDCGVTPGPDILGRHNHRRWVTDWKGVPRE